MSLIPPQLLRLCFSTVCCLKMIIHHYLDSCWVMLRQWTNEPIRCDESSSFLLLTFTEVCQTSGFLKTWLTNFILIFSSPPSLLSSSSLHAVTVFEACYLWFCSSGVSRATLSCSLRPSARSSSSQTSSPSPPILMSCMRVPKISLEDRCDLRSMTLVSFFSFVFSFPDHHLNYLAHTHTHYHQSALTDFTLQAYLVKQLDSRDSHQNTSWWCFKLWILSGHWSASFRPDLLR